MARDPGTYSEEIVREFYASYAATLHGSISKRLKPWTKILSLPLWSGVVRWTYHMPPSATFFMVRPQRNVEQREAVILWLAKYIIVDGEHAEWVTAPRLGIRKATLNFVAKFFWLLVRNRVSPTKTDNQLTWDRVITVVALVAGVEIDFACMLLIEIHERAFKTSTTYPFPCLIFQLCRDSVVPICHCDRLIHPTGTLDIGLIRDKANVAAPRREPQIDVPPLGTDLADTVGQAQGSDPMILDHSDTVLAFSSQSTEIGGSDGHAVASHSALDAKVDSRVRSQTGAKDEGHDGLKGPGTSLRTDVDAILTAPTVEPQAAPTVLDDDMVLDVLFSGTTEEGLEPTHAKVLLN
ncbi:hypothetical protein H5410_036968 [Solanum commersonii]|uniref:Putative plant transposon protein domain-containing protein n=1 Tax=Solanum commersonii TaxID=4109 RepID=A0A9J5Y860_SOLCO|nr:hypothetical protein H5410_036968 [Solanum commersonii]